MKFKSTFATDVEYFVPYLIIIMGMILLLTVMVKTNSANSYQLITDIYSIEQDESNTFYLGLGTGSEDDEAYYYFYIKDNGEYILDKIKKTQATINYENAEQPYLLSIEVEDAFVERRLSSAEINVPENTVIRHYSEEEIKEMEKKEIKNDN